MRILVAAILLCSGSVLAQAWPAKPLRVVVPFAPGGTVDVLTRFIGERLTGALGQPVVVENRPGAGGNVGAAEVARAAADGYTLLVSGSPTHAVNPHLYKNLPFDAVRDFTPIALLGASPNLLVVNPSLPVHSVEDLVRLAKQKPGGVDFSSSGSGTSGHLAGELLKGRAGVDLRHVPYKGQADAITAVIRGDVAFSFVTVPATLPHVKSGRLRAIAITSVSRSELAPEIPTVAQAGYPDFEVLGWYAMYAPRGAPAEAVARLTGELGKLFQEARTRERLQQLGAEPRFLSGEAFREFSASESAKWGKVIRDSGAQAD